MIVLNGPWLIFPTNRIWHWKFTWLFLPRKISFSLFLGRPVSPQASRARVETIAAQDCLAKMRLSRWVGQAATLPGLWLLPWLLYHKFVLHTILTLGSCQCDTLERSNQDFDSWNSLPSTVSIHCYGSPELLVFAKNSTFSEIRVWSQNRVLGSSCPCT